MAAKNFICGRCKRSFVSEQAVRDHITDAHKRGGNIGIFQRIDAHNGREFDDEPSMAERAVDAAIDLAMGNHTDDEWLLP